METTDDYRLSHANAGKGTSYQESFETYSYRRHMWAWEKVQLKNVISNHLEKEKTILDFACGTGRISAELAKISENVTGIDVSESMLEVARKRVPTANLINVDITQKGAYKAQNQFQIIVAFRFFLNAQLSLKKEALSALNPLLEKGGIFIFNNHGNSSHLGLMFQIAIMKIKQTVQPSKGHFVPKKLSRGEINQLLDTEGFEIIESYHRNVWPIMSEKTKGSVSKFESLENWFSKRNFFEKFSRNIIYVCKKK